MSVCQAVEASPSMALPAVPGLSASPSGEKTVAWVGLTMLPEAAGAVDVVVLSPSSSLLSPPPTLPKILLTTDASTTRATRTMTAPAPTPISRLRRRRPNTPYSPASGRRAEGGRGVSSIGPSTSVRSATAVACCNRFKSVDALRIPPSS